MLAARFARHISCALAAGPNTELWSFAEQMTCVVFEFMSRLGRQNVWTA